LAARREASQHQRITIKKIFSSRLTETPGVQRKTRQVFSDTPPV
jgi:hypothetical protein